VAHALFVQNYTRLVPRALRSKAWVDGLLRSQVLLSHNVYNHRVNMTDGFVRATSFDESTLAHPSLREGWGTQNYVGTRQVTYYLRH
jgi:hypothetical protein